MADMSLDEWTAKVHAVFVKGICGMADEPAIRNFALALRVAADAVTSGRWYPSADDRAAMAELACAVARSDRGSRDYAPSLGARFLAARAAKNGGVLYVDKG